LRIGNDFQCVGGWCCGGVAYGRSGGGACGVTATIVVVAMDREMGPLDAGAFTTEWMVAGSKRLFLMTAIKSDLGGGLRRPNGGEIGGRATCSDHYYISVHGSCLTYFINPQRYLPTTQKKGIKESIAVMPGLVRISNRVLWVSR